MEDQKIFPLIEDGRPAVLDQLLSVHGRILLFYTFIQEFIYFKACSTVLRRLLPAKFKHTVSTKFFSSYTGINQDQGLCLIQVGENKMLSWNGRLTINPKLGYQQLSWPQCKTFPL